MVISTAVIATTKAIKHSDDSNVSFLYDKIFSILTFVFAPPKVEEKNTLPEALPMMLIFRIQ